MRYIFYGISAVFGALVMLVYMCLASGQMKKCSCLRIKKFRNQIDALGKKVQEKVKRIGRFYKCKIEIEKSIWTSVVLSGNFRILC